MAYAESNPIQQRIELFLEKWEATIAVPEIKLVHIHAQENEKDMVDAFYTYLLGVDTGNNDVPIIFNSIFYDAEQYSNALLDELTDMIDTWNGCTKDNVEVVIQHLDWKVDYTLRDPKNPSYTFIQNINNLAQFLNLAEGIHLVPILKVSFLQSSDIIQWMHNLLQSTIHPSVKLMLDDTVTHPFYHALVAKNTDKAITIIPDMNMDTALQQVASMGNPNDPGVQYRKAFLAMMQAIEKRKESETLKHADECLKIAYDNLEKNQYWIGQVVAVNTALANDQVGYRNFKKAINYSSVGVQAVIDFKEKLTDEFVWKKLFAQAVMLRGSLFAADKNWNNALTDFSEAADNYIDTSDTILALEALRMMAYSSNKNGDRDAACVALVDAVELSKQMPVGMLKFTTFAGVIEMLLDINNFKYISYDDVAFAAQNAFGDNWQSEIQNWKNPVMDQQTSPSQAIAH